MGTGFFAGKPMIRTNAYGLIDCLAYTAAETPAYALVARAPVPRA